MLKPAIVPAHRIVISTTISIMAASALTVTNGKKAADRDATWSTEEVDTSLDVWGEEAVQNHLDGSTRNRHVFDNIIRRLTEAGYNQTASQCRVKLNALKREYRLIKDFNNRSGNSHKTSRYNIY